MKRIISILIVLTMLLAALPLTAYAAGTQTDSPAKDALADTAAAADVAATGTAMRIRQQPPAKASISLNSSSDPNPIYPSIVFGVGGGTGVYTFDWYYGGDDEFAIGENIASTTGPVYQPTRPGYYFCWVHDSAGDSVMTDRTRVYQKAASPAPVKAHIAGTKLEWFESAATGSSKTHYRISVFRKDKTHNDTTYKYQLDLVANTNGSIYNFYGYHGNNNRLNESELNSLEAAYDASKHLYSLNIDYALGLDYGYSDIDYQFVVYDATYNDSTAATSGYLSAKKMHEGTMVKYFDTDLWREGEVQINDGEYTPGSTLKPNINGGRWAGRLSKVKVFLQEYSSGDWRDVKEISVAYTVKTEDVGKRLRFKIMPKNPYERWAGELYWDKEAFYSDAVTITKPVKYVTGSVECSITEPKAGRKASTYISCTDPNNGKYYVLSNDTPSTTALNWYNSSGQLVTDHAFAGGDTYTAEICFDRITDSAYTYNYDGLKIYINGAEATVTRQGMSKMYAKRSFTLPDARVIDRVLINVTKPVAGAYPNYNATAQNATGWDVEKSFSTYYCQNGVLWRNVTDDYYLSNDTSLSKNRFEKGKRYEVIVSLVVTSNYYVFAEKNLVTGSVNQNFATVGDYDDGNEGQNIFLTYTFDLDDVVRNISASVSEPANGGKPVWSVDYPAGSRYRIDSMSVSWYEDGFSMMRSDTFRSGHEYTVKFTAKADDDCRFTDETIALVNGHEATISEKRVDIYGTHSAMIEYTFRLGGSSGGGILGDADGDGSVTILDATKIQRWLAKLTTELNTPCADADGDGSITILDATAIQRYLAKLKTNPNIGKPIA